MLTLSDFDYYLPKELIAQYPVKPRSSSRLLVLNRKTEKIKHDFFYNLPEYLNPSDTIVLNNTKVYPARLLGVNEGNGKKIEVFLLQNAGTRSLFECLLKPSRHVQEKDSIVFGNGILKAEILTKRKRILVNLTAPGGQSVKNLIQKIGHMPLPPYIKRAADESDKKDYQTVYARQSGAVAAPTAGLHFTDDLLSGLKEKGVNIAALTLHTGYGTFAPVRTESFYEHQMHKENFSISKTCVDIINRTKAGQKRVFAAGTTTARALEASAGGGKVKVIRGETNIFIYPPYKFKIADALITNFHLPKTTLLLMVAAFCQGNNDSERFGINLLRHAYQVAIKEKYRFYSYGDAMLII